MPRCYAFLNCGYKRLLRQQRSDKHEEVKILCNHTKHFDKFVTLAHYNI